MLTQKRNTKNKRTVQGNKVKQSKARRWKNTREESWIRTWYIAIVHGRDVEKKKRKKQGGKKDHQTNAYRYKIINSWKMAGGGMS